MTLHLTPAVIVGCYEFLRATPPFDKWKLPEADDVEFRTISAVRLYGEHQIYTTGEHIIYISHRRVGYTRTLMETMAHEMVHVRQAMRGDRDVHGASFKMMARRVCEYHGFDPMAF